MVCLNYHNIKHAHTHRLKGNDCQMLPSQPPFQKQDRFYTKSFSLKAPSEAGIELTYVEFAVDLQSFIEITVEMGNVITAHRFLAQ